MRIEDFGDYWKLRRLSLNPWRVVRFRKRQCPGDTLRVELRSGASLELRGGLQDHHISHRIFLRDEYRLAGSERLGCVVDLGANVGLFSARIAARARRVIACEPVEANYVQLVRNVASFPNVETLRTAVSGTVGRATIYRPHSAGMSGGFSLFPGEGRTQLAEVPTLSLEALFEQCGVERCDLLKLDVEGAEYEILYRAPPAVMARIDRLCAEFHPSAEPHCSAAELCRELRAQGFAVRFEPRRRPEGAGMLFADRRMPASADA